MLLTRPPDIVLADFGRLLAARAADGNYYVAARRRKADALVPDARDRRGAAALAGGRERGGRASLECPSEGRCFYTASGRRVALVTQRGRAAGRLRHGRCDRRAGAGRVRLPLADPDRGPDRQLAPGRLRAVARTGGIIVESANASRGDRPWVPHPVSARERARRAKPEGQQEEPVPPDAPGEM